MFIVQICGFPTLLHAKKIVFLQCQMNNGNIMLFLERERSCSAIINKVPYLNQSLGQFEIYV